MLIDFYIFSFLVVLISLYNYSNKLAAPLEEFPRDEKSFRWYPAKTMRHAGLSSKQILPGYWGVKFILPILSIMIIQELGLELPFLMMPGIVSLKLFLLVMILKLHGYYMMQQLH